METQKRMYGNYEIIQSCTIGSVELVIGHNPHAPSLYVCWYCEDGSEYFWGDYYDSLESVQQTFKERCRCEEKKLSIRTT